MDPAAEMSNAVPPPGAVAVTVAVAAPPAPAPAPPPAAARPARRAAARPARSPRCARAALATALFVLGCAAAAFALFAVTLHHSAESRILSHCAATDAEAAGLRAASELLLLLASSAQVLAATAALLVPAGPLAFFGYALGWLTAYRATPVVWMLVACHGRVHGWLAFHFWLFYAVLLATLLVGFFAAIR